MSKEKYMSNSFTDCQYEALSGYISSYILDSINNPNKVATFSATFSEVDLMFLKNACDKMAPMSVKMNKDKDILYCPVCERQAKRSYDLFCSGCGQKLSYDTVDNN